MTAHNWGILGTGNIAGSMAAALPHVPGACRAAVASRTIGKAEGFARAWGFDRAYGSYDDLLQDPDIDIIYVATPNALHKGNIFAVLDAGKHVLCEKPMTLSPQDSAACFEMARQRGRVLMEALWSAFVPAMQKAIDLVRSGAIGTPRHLMANFVSHRDPATTPILFDPDLGGGARKDLGIYPIAAALLLAGPVRYAQSHSVMGPSGVDEMTGWTLEHDNGALSLLSCGFRADLPVAVRCMGSEGSLQIPDNFHHASSVILDGAEGQVTFDLPYIGNGYAHEAIAFQACLDGAKTAWPEGHTIASAELLHARSV
ncbi:hypothetical protein ACMU_14450 [Actibacterium mucosum KCTC 23349]|uniref:Uncharacterized protein n=1 Tax=Actibacterium mucosum KCTC 23349 TaxID=1454373 RepID=A0A037ZFQ6_9RHOB|nr:Gfo/Idh/MocA family oxidoreductase [Actibacterium mucosum]KAJ54958.1 hypothetical protein ACMU_14450 [Actibacterium mucosum KCTC 23349]